MQNNIRKFFTLLLLVFLLIAPFADAENALSCTIVGIEKHGNLILSISGTDFLKSGYEYGDIITAAIAGSQYDMPVCTNYSDVETGELICRIHIDPAEDADQVLLAVNMDNFAVAKGIAEKQMIEAEPGYVWIYNPELMLPVEVSIRMKEKGGYYDEWVLRQLMRSNERADYPHLTDAEFANFRSIETVGMGDGVLYRSSSPVNPELGRNSYADAAMEEAEIRTIINLADSISPMQSFPGYYEVCSKIGLDLSVDFDSPDFESGLASGLRFMIENDAPYLVHCNEGKDRAGFVSAILECLMGAGADEVIADYMVTYFNYYGVEPNTEQYDAIAQSNIRKSLASAFDVEDIAAEGIDLAAEAEEYLLEKLLLTQTEVDALKAKLD